MFFELTQNVRFNQNMDNFKLIFLSGGQLEDLSFDKFFLTVFKLLTCYKFFLVSLFLPLLLNCSAETVLNSLTDNGHSCGHCGTSQNTFYTIFISRVNNLHQLVKQVQVIFK